MVPIASVRNDEGSDAAKLLLRRWLVGNAIATVCRSKNPTLQNWKQFEFAKMFIIFWFFSVSRFFLVLRTIALAAFASEGEKGQGSRSLCLRKS